MDFFKDIDRSLKEEGEELGTVGKALQDQLRMQKRAKRIQRTESSQRLAGKASSRSDDLLSGAREAYQRSASCSALPSMPVLQRPGLQDWEVHDGAWESFESNPSEPLYVEMVPWPPRIDDILDFYEQVHASGLKKAYKLACRRWHPDKFLQRFGGLVPPEELKYMTF